jgi:hypothetical protein
MVYTYRFDIGDLCALYVLAYMLHKSTNRKKGKTISITREGAITYLLQNVPVRTHTCIYNFSNFANIQEGKYNNRFEELHDNIVPQFLLLSMQWKC